MFLICDFFFLFVHLRHCSMLFHCKMDCEWRIVSDKELRRSWPILRFYLTVFRPCRMVAGFLVLSCRIKLGSLLLRFIVLNGALEKAFLWDSPLPSASLHSAIAPHSSLTPRMCVVAMPSRHVVLSVVLQRLHSSLTGSWLNFSYLSVW